ncbi:GNAT family N-acetyltransferase [Halobium salinum]|uniref:GNAT family N-acetyltransferase n=1 Tax=Halobium salinum TaxID=1364940 RepID=A0ABD5P834_9EURY|nr:GNAT family N-acetyltransferase [Halobium salinum]
MNDLDGYTLHESVPAPEEYMALREAAGMPARSLEGARAGLPNTVYGVSVRRDRAGDDHPRGDTDGELVGMGRVVGDGGTTYVLSDVAVDPAVQGRGLGTRITEALVEWVDEHAPSRAYVTLVADVEGFYERFGFERTAPDSHAMFRRVE